MFATNDAIKLGARITVGALGCWNAVQQSEESDEYEDENENENEDEDGDGNGSI
ncbi:MAG: hypothetical protein ACI9LX_000849 [Paraglaciecola sp.]